MQGTSDLIEHEPHISLLSEAAAQTVEDLQAESFVGSRVVTRVNVHLDLWWMCGQVWMFLLLMTHITNSVES